MQGGPSGPVPKPNDMGGPGILSIKKKNKKKNSQLPIPSA
jgi:hypothetical protein